MSGYQIGQNFNCNGINYKLTDIETDGDVTRITYKGQYFEVGQSYNNNGKNCTISRIYVQGNDVTIYLESEEEYEDFDLILPKKYLDNLCLLNKSSHLSNDLIDESNQAVQLPNFIDEKSEIMIQSQHNQSQQRWFERIYFCLLKSLNCFTVTQNDDEADTTQSIGEFLEEGDSSEHEFLERYRILNSNVYKLSESDQKRYTWYCQMLTVLQYNIMNGNDKTVVLKLNLLIGRVVDEEASWIRVYIITCLSLSPLKFQQIICADESFIQTLLLFFNDSCKSVRTAAYGLFEKLINIGSKELKKKYEKEKVILEQYGGGPKRNSSNTGAVSVRNSAYCPGCPFKSNGSNLSRHFYISCKKPFFHEGTKFSTCLIDLLKQVIASGKRVTATEIIEAGTETLKSIPKFAAILQEHIDTNTMGSVYVYVNEEFDAVLNLLHEKATKNNNYVERGRRNVLKGDHNDYSLILKTTLDFIQNSDEPLKAWLEKLMHLIYWGHSTNFSFRDDSSIATCLSYGMLKYVSAKYYHFLYPLKKLLCGESIEELRGKTVKIIRVIENVPLILAQYYETCGIGDSFHPFMTNVQIGNRSQFVEVGDKFGSETFSETGAMLQLLAIQSKPEELKIFDFLKDPKLTSFDSSLESYVQANKINNVHLLQSSFSLHCLKSEDVVAFVNRVIPSDFFQSQLANEDESIHYFLNPIYRHFLEAHGISIPSSFSSQSSHIQRSLDANLFSFENDADNYFFNVTYSEGIGMPDTEEGYIHFRISDHSRNLFDMNRIPIDTTTCEDGNGLKAFLDGDGIVFGNRDVYPMAEGPEGQDTSLDPISAPTRSRGEQFDHDFDGPEPMDSQDEVQIQEEVEDEEVEDEEVENGIVEDEEVDDEEDEYPPPVNYFNDMLSSLNSRDEEDLQRIIDVDIPLWLNRLQRQLTREIISQQNYLQFMAIINNIHVQAVNILNGDNVSSQTTLPQAFHNFVLGYDESHPQKDWDQQRFVKIFGQLLSIPYKGTKITLCPFCLWKGPKAQLFLHLKRKHSCGKGQQQKSCIKCKCPVPNNTAEIEEHMHERCFKTEYQKGIIELLKACVGEYDIAEIFESFRNRST